MSVVAESGVQRPHVLVADDDIVLQKLFRRCLQDGLTYDVRTVSDGEAALREFDDFSPDVVVLDLLMPKRNGFEVCRVLKSRPSSSHVPVCVLTAMSDDQARTAALAAGADDFLNKPVHVAELRLRVHVLAKRKLNADYLHATAGEMEQWRREHQDLVGLLVHDMRGPLSAMASTTAFLERTDNASDRQYLVTVLKDGVQRLCSSLGFFGGSL
jgi:DNA-binding response OmpR family regulator